MTTHSTSPRLDDRRMPFTAGDARRIFDGTGLWCCNAGHRRRGTSTAASRQAARLGFGPTFRMDQPLPFELTERLVSAIRQPR